MDLPEEYESLIRIEDFYIAVVVKVVKPFSQTFETGGLKGALRESWRKSLHNLHN